MSPTVRKSALALHLTVSMGWIGAAGAYWALAFWVAFSQNAKTVSAGWMAMEIIGWSVLVPLSAATVLTGLLMSVGSPWGLFRHYWVVISLVVTVVATGVLILHMPDVSLAAAAAQKPGAGGLDHVGSDLFHSTLGIATLVGVAVLNIYKPRGLTRYGWRKEQEERRNRSVRAPTAAAKP